MGTVIYEGPWVIVSNPATGQKAHHPDCLHARRAAFYNVSHVMIDPRPHVVPCSFCKAEKPYGGRQPKWQPVFCPNCGGELTVVNRNLHQHKCDHCWWRGRVLTTWSEIAPQ